MVRPNLSRVAAQEKALAAQMEQAEGHRKERRCSVRPHECSSHGCVPPATDLHLVPAPPAAHTLQLWWAQWRAAKITELETQALVQAQQHSRTEAMSAAGAAERSACQPYTRPDDCYDSKLPRQTKSSVYKCSSPNVQT